MDFGEMHRVKTRKPHRCEWCGEPILVGSEVGNYRGFFQGDWQNWYMHPECEQDYDKVDLYPDEGFVPYNNERPRIEVAG